MIDFMKRWTDQTLISSCEKMIDSLLADRGFPFDKTDPENIERFKNINKAFTELIRRFEANPKAIGASGQSYECTLDDATLVSRVKAALVELVETVGESWMLHIPARPDSDPDLIMTELVQRYVDKLK